MPEFNPNVPFKIVHVESGGFLDVFDGSNSQWGDQLVLSPYHGRPSQYFVYRDGMIYSQKNGKVLDVSQDARDGRAIIACFAHGNVNQLWTIKQNGRIKSKTGAVIGLRDTPTAPIYPLKSAYATAKQKKGSGERNQKFALVN